VEGATGQKANDRVTVASVLPANTGCIDAACPIRKELGKRQGYTGNASGVVYGVPTSATIPP
jgi:hypothetical protein